MKTRLTTEERVKQFLTESGITGSVGLRLYGEHPMGDGTYELRNVPCAWIQADYVYYRNELAHGWVKLRGGFWGTSWKPAFMQESPRNLRGVRR